MISQYFLQQCDAAEHGSGASRRPWGFRFRKPSFTVKKMTDTTPGDGVINEVCAPELNERLSGCFVPVGGTAVLQCTLRRGIRHTSALWRKTSPDSRVLRHAGKHAISLSKDGIVRLVISECSTSDAGTYTCSISNDLGSVQSSCELRVGGNENGMSTVSEPKSQPSTPGTPNSVPDDTCLWERQQFLRR